MLQSGYYTNAANVAITSSVYAGQTLQPFVEVSADLYSGFTNSGNALGLVVNYRNAANFYEVRFTATGVVTIDKIVNGVRTMLQTGSYTAPPKTFFHVSVLRDFERIEVRVNNGLPITAEDSALRDGQAGVFASWNRARFDNFVIDQLSTWGVGFQTDFGHWHLIRSRHAPARGWSRRTSYQNTTNESAAISTAGFPRAADDFILYASLRGQWSNAGNRGGLVWDYRDHEELLRRIAFTRHCGARGNGRGHRGRRGHAPRNGQLERAIACGGFRPRNRQSNRRSIAHHRARNVGAVSRRGTAGTRRRCWSHRELEPRPFRQRGVQRAEGSDLDEGFSFRLRACSGRCARFAMTASGARLTLRDIERNRRAVAQRRRREHPA